MKRLLAFAGLFACVFTGLLLAKLDYSEIREVQRYANNARDSAYTLSKTYTTTQISTFQSSNPFFSAGAELEDTLRVISSDTTDTMLIYWNSDTLWIAVNAGVVAVPDLSGFLADSWEDSINFLLAYIDTLKAICDSLGDSLGNISGGGGDTIPPGCIMIWGGDTTNVPTGWSICDGDTFTLQGADTIWEPDLRDRFVLSYGTKYAVNDTGGLDSLTMTGTTDAGSAHTHTIAGLVLDSTVRYPGTGTKIYIPRLSVGTNLPTNNNEDAHTHTFTSSKQTNIPPYYVLCYIFKL